MTVCKEIIINHPLSKEQLEDKSLQAGRAYLLSLSSRMELTLLLLGKEADGDTRAEISKALEFLTIIEHDLKRQDNLVVGHINEKSQFFLDTLDPLLYRPSEVLPKNIPNIEEALTKTRQLIQNILDSLSTQPVSRDDLIEAINLLRKLSKKYEQCQIETAAETRGERIDWSIN